MMKKKVEDELLAEIHRLDEIRNKDKDRSKWRRLLSIKKPKLK